MWVEMWPLGRRVRWTYKNAMESFSGKSDPWMDSIETIVEFRSRVRYLCAAADARATRSRLVSHHSPATVHVNSQVPGRSSSGFIGDGDGFLHGMYHPNFGNINHKRETNAQWSEIGGKSAETQILSILELSK
jgi:hypothetical protein